MHLPFSPSNPISTDLSKDKMGHIQKKHKKHLIYKGFIDLPICNNKNKTKQKC